MEIILSGLMQMDLLLLLPIGSPVALMINNQIVVERSALPGDSMDTQLSGIDPVQTKTTTPAALNYFSAAVIVWNTIQVCPLTNSHKVF